MYDSSHLCDCWENPATNVIKLAVVTHVPPCLSSFALLNSCKLLSLFIESVFRYLFGRTHNFIAHINSLTSLPEVSRAPPWGGGARWRCGLTWLTSCWRLLSEKQVLATPSDRLLHLRRFRVEFPLSYVSDWVELYSMITILVWMWKWF